MDKIEIKNLECHLDRERRFEKISLPVYFGQISIILGRNGVGKSTFLNLIFNYFTENTKLSVAIVRQSLQLNFNLSIQEFLELGKPSFVEDVTLLSKFRKTLDDLGVKQNLNTPVFELSGGEWQLVRLARSLSHKHQVLLLDEPVQYLDYFNKNNFYSVLKNYIEKENAIVMMIAHDIDYLESFKGQIAHLDIEELKVYKLDKINLEIVKHKIECK